MTAADRAEAIQWARLSLVGSALLFGIEVAGYVMTHSAALLSDALETIANLVTSSLAIYAVSLSARPSDANHPYGHGKVEYLTAGLEGGLVAVAGVASATVGVRRILQPIELETPGVGAAFALLGAILALAIGLALRRAGRRLRSPALEADGLHVLSDGLTSLAAAAGLAGVAATGLVLIDSVIGVALGAWLIGHGARVVRGAVGGLLDEATPELVEDVAAALRAARKPGWMLPHAVKLHRLGHAVHVDLHIVFPRYWTLERAHSASHDASDAIRGAFGPTTDVMVHAESCADANCATCDVEDCPIRAHAAIGTPTWTADWIARRTR